MRKITIVISYYNRQNQLNTTLSTIERSLHNNFGVIVVDDASIKPLIVGGYSFPVHVISIDKDEKRINKWITPATQINKGIKHALDLESEIIILQNAEARHCGDVLMYIEENLTQNNYISMGCFSLSNKSTYDPGLEQNIKSIIEENNKCATDSEHDSWYNHPLYRGTGYDFCSAVTKENMIKLNGFDEEFSSGICYCDDDMVRRVKVLGLKIDIPTEPIVLHQWHEGSNGSGGGVLTENNKKLYTQKTKLGQFKATHIFNEDF